MFQLANLGQHSLADLPPHDLVDETFRMHLAAILRSNPEHYSWAMYGRVIWADPSGAMLAVTSSEELGFHLTYLLPLHDPTEERLAEALQAVYERIGNAITQSGNTHWNQSVGVWFKAHRFNAMLVRAFNNSQQGALVVGDVPLEPLRMSMLNFDLGVSSLIVGRVIRH